MFSIATLTMNPTVDLAYEVEHVVDTHKMRATGEYCNPGGGGINVARVFVRLGGNARCVYPSGGPVGVAFDRLVDQHQLVRTCVPIAGNTRIANTVLERSTGREFRFVPAGPELAEEEWHAVLEALATLSCDYLVASGSLPRGAPVDFYARAAGIAEEIGARFVLDSSGAALKGGLGQASVHLLKPSLSEFCALVGEELEEPAALARAARDLQQEKRVELIAITLGHRGAILVSDESALYLPAVPIRARSAVGAGDSFVGAMVHRLCAGDTPDQAFRFAVAAGTAAVSTPGTQLCQPSEIEAVLPKVAVPVAL